ncbi:MAG: type II toxin-antitoxin system death-on-curing family toxin [Pirellulales bacterium]|nr:type II toxin-antitoxin system death-on-curing family toxin [Pirellulales bacterium]
MTDFLSVEDVLVLHANQIGLYGGDQGVRALGLLESAITQPQATFGGQVLHEFPFEMAAAYFFHILQNHPFIDGNKRTGTVAALVFLDLNGIETPPGRQARPRSPSFCDHGPASPPPSRRPFRAPHSASTSRDFIRPVEER